MTAGAEGQVIFDGADNYSMLIGLDDPLTADVVSATLTIVPEPTALALWMGLIPLLMRGRAGNSSGAAG
jgi:hypothetical protein